MGNRFERALSQKHRGAERQAQEAEKRFQKAKQNLEELIEFLNGRNGLGWFREQLKETRTVKSRDISQFTVGNTDGFVVDPACFLDRSVPKTSDCFDLKLILKGSKGKANEIFFAERMGWYYPEITPDSPRELTSSDLSNPEYQEMARNAARELAEREGKLLDASSEIFIFYTQTTECNNPYGCVLIRRQTPEALTKKQGSNWVNSLCDVFGQTIQG